MSDLVTKLLAKSRVIAVVGHSDKPGRESYRIGRYLRDFFTVYPVNPALTSIEGDKCYASLADVPEHIDIVNVFRRSEHLQGVVEDAIAVGAGAVWAQLGVQDQGAFDRAQKARLPMVMDTCIFVEHRDRYHSS